jgi:polar amino acid transport system substrate-binding protein
LSFPNKAISGVILAFLLVSNPALSAPGDSTQTPEADSKVLVIASHADYPPYEYYDPLEDRFKGFNVEVLDALARRMGVKIEYRRMSKVAGLSAIIYGEVDGVLGVAYSIERDKYLDFTSPLCTVSDAIFVRDDTENIGSIVDLAGRTVAVDRDDLVGDVLSRHDRIHVVPTKSYEHALELLERGDVAAFVGNQLTGQYLIARSGPRNIKIVGSPLHQVGYGIAVHEDNHQLISQLEKALTAIKENGEYDLIFETWFGGDLRRQTPMARFLYWALGLVVIVLGAGGWLVNRRLRQSVEISAKELAESKTQFQRKAEEYASLFEGANDAIFLINPSDGRFLEVNRKAEELTGYTRDELLRMSMRDIHLPSDGARVDKRIAQIHSEGSASFDDAPMLRKDGSINHVDISASIIRYSGQEVIQSFLRNVTEKRALQKQVKQTDKLASIGTFTAGLAHEIRNPLNSVNLQLLLLERRIQDGKMFSKSESIELINIVREEVSRLDNLVTEFLFFAKPLNLDFYPTNIHRILDDVFALFHARIEQNNITLERRYEDNMPLLALDAEKTKQALINIVQNSIEAMTDGGVLRVQTEGKAKKVSIRIEDSGEGIPQEDLDKVFEVFYTSKEQGTGLGLPISFHIIEMQGGTLEIESREGEGTACTIAFKIGPPKYQPTGKEHSIGV